MSKRPATTGSTQVRFPTGLLDTLRAKAGENGRTLNGEIVARIEASLLDEGGEPENRALRTAIDVLMSRFAFFVGEDDEKRNRDLLQLLNVAIPEFLNGLGANAEPTSEAAREAGTRVARRLIEQMRRAVGKQRSEMHEEEAALAEAAKIWGLQAKGKGE